MSPLPMSVLVSHLWFQSPVTHNTLPHRRLRTLGGDFYESLRVPLSSLECHLWWDRYASSGLYTYVEHRDYSTWLLSRSDDTKRTGFTENRFMIGPSWNESKVLVCSSPHKSHYTDIWERVLHIGLRLVLLCSLSGFPVRCFINGRGKFSQYILQ